MAARSPRGGSKDATSPSRTGLRRAERTAAVGSNAAGRMSDAALWEVEDRACPGAGACGGQFTANTMATACEFLGLAPMGSGDVPAVDNAKEAVAERIGT